jgi:hypothetical protein
MLYFHFIKWGHKVWGKVRCRGTIIELQWTYNASRRLDMRLRVTWSRNNNWFNEIWNALRWPNALSPTWSKNKVLKLCQNLWRLKNEFWKIKMQTFVFLNKSLKPNVTNVAPYCSSTNTFMTNICVWMCVFSLQLYKKILEFL